MHNEKAIVSVLFCGQGTLVLNHYYLTRHEALRTLALRLENKESFPGEFVCDMPFSAYRGILRAFGLPDPSSYWLDIPTKK